MRRALLLLTCIGLLSVLDCHAESDEFARKLLCLTKDSAASLQRAGADLQLVPVLLPEGKHLLGVNDHFGWPVGTMSGKAIVVVFHRLPQHWGAKEKPDADTSTAVAIRSTDGGKRWSEPVNLRKLVKQPTKDCRLGFGNTIGTDKDGAVVVVTSYGVFRSEDEGATWRHLPGAFGGNQLKGPKTNNGPQLALHPVYGLVAPGHCTSEGAGKVVKNPDGTPFIPPQLWVRWSTDGGSTWQEAKQDLPSFASAVEPSAIVHNGAMFLVARCHGADSFDAASKTWRYVQLWSTTGWMPFQAALSSIRATDVREGRRNSYHGPWSQDTVDLSFNPVTHRIDCVATDRNGESPAGSANTRDCQTLNLWSIDPAAFRKGETEWKFEATLLKRHGSMAKGEIDGMHPGAAVIDTTAGVQHIFIYSGAPTGPSGVFRLTRTLDTPKLKAALN